MKHPPHLGRSLFREFHGLGGVARALLLLGIPLVLLVGWVGTARAGTLQVRDEAHVLAPDDIGRLRSVVSSTPFDARLLVTTAFADAQELSHEVGSLVSEPNQVVVGVDPQHRHVQVHFGTGSGIPRRAWPEIERAGNDAFRRGDWAGGASAIFRAAGAEVERSPGGALQPVQSHSFFGPGTVMLVILGVLGVGLLAFLFRRRAQGFYGPGPGTAPGYGPYAGGPGYGGVPPQGGMGPLGGGLIGAGLGGLAGYELGKLEGEREHEHGRDVAPPDTTPDGGGGNFDAGGGGSDWGDGGGNDGGGFDGGGGDSGGGSDF